MRYKVDNSEMFFLYLMEMEVFQHCQRCEFNNIWLKSCNARRLQAIYL